MAYAVTFVPAAAKSIEKFEKVLLRRLRSKVLSLADAPRPAGAVKLAGQSDLYRVRVGNYRIVYRVDDAAGTVEVTLVAHRREIYRGL